MKSDNYIRLELPSRSSNEAVARGVVAAFAAQLDPTLEELGDIKTAVSEAVTNCIVHAYPDTVGSIHLHCETYPDRTLSLEIRDQGVGIPDVQAARAPMFTTGGAERSGMGFTIMEKFMSTLQVESAPGAGTRVTMTRTLRGTEH